VNDISGFRWDPKMAKTLAELKVGAVLMHTRGRPEEWRDLPPIGDPVLLVKRELRQFAEAARWRRQARSSRARSRFRVRQEARGELSAARTFCELQQMGFRCWRESRESRSSDVRWQGTVMTRQLGSASTGRWLRSRSSF